MNRPFLPDVLIGVRLTLTAWFHALTQAFGVFPVWDIRCKNAAVPKDSTETRGEYEQFALEVLTTPVF